MSKHSAGFLAQHDTLAVPSPVAAEGAERSEFENIADEIGKLVTKKNASYGSAYKKTSIFLRILFPNGIHPDRYDDALLMVRVFDKQMRLATRPDAFAESPWRDIGGYGVCGVEKDSKFEGKGPAPKKEGGPCVGEKV